MTCETSEVERRWGTTRLWCEGRCGMVRECVLGIGTRTRCRLVLSTFQVLVVSREVEENKSSEAAKQRFAFPAPLLTRHCSYLFGSEAHVSLALHAAGMLASPTGHFSANVPLHQLRRGQSANVERTAGAIRSGEDVSSSTEVPALVSRVTHRRTTPFSSERSSSKPLR